MQSILHENISEVVRLGSDTFWGLILLSKMSEMDSGGDTIGAYFKALHNKQQDKKRRKMKEARNL